MSNTPLSSEFYSDAKQATYTPLQADTQLVKPVQFQELFVEQIVKIGNTFKGFFTPAVFPYPSGNVGFDYGVKLGTQTAEAGGKAVETVIKDVKEGIENVGASIRSGVSSFASNAVIFAIVAIIVLLVISRVVKKSI